MIVQTKAVSAEFLAAAASRNARGVTVCVACGRSVGFVTNNRAPGVLPRHLDCTPEVVDAEFEQLEREYQVTKGMDYSKYGL